MTVTYAPLQELGSLMAGASGPVPDDGVLAGPWRNPGGAFHWYARSAWALADIVAWWRGINGSTRPRLWVPAYFCNGALAPARAAGAELRFYGIDAALNPDWADAEQLTADGKPDLIVLVHYFGHAADGAAARAFADAHGALLIEDAAHVLGPGPEIGRFGDFTFYSPYKFLPIPSGAILITGTEAAADFAPTPKAAAPATGVWRAKQVIQHCLPAAALAARTRRRTIPFEADGAGGAPPASEALADLSKRLLAGQLESLENIARRRRDTAQALREIFAGHAGTPFFASPEAEGPAPYRFVLDCGEKSTATRLYQKIRARGVPAETWPDLPPEIIAAPARYPTARRLRDQLVFLPVHQSLTPSELRQALGSFGA